MDKYLEKAFREVNKLAKREGRNKRDAVRLERKLARKQKRIKQGW